MIDYQTYCQIRHLALEKKLTPRQIARELKLNRKTVRKWVKRDSFQKARPHSLCKRLQQSENILSAEDAYWHGIVDEVLGSQLPCVREVTEYTPAEEQTKEKPNDEPTCAPAHH